MFPIQLESQEIININEQHDSSLLYSDEMGSTKKEPTDCTWFYIKDYKTKVFENILFTDQRQLQDKTLEKLSTEFWGTITFNRNPKKRLF